MNKIKKPLPKDTNPEKLQKVLARAGLGSRRELERWIEDGRVKVNGKTAELGCRVSLQDKIKVDNRYIKLKPSSAEKTRVILYHKPLGEICTRSDPEGRKTVFDNLPSLQHGRWILVGRLDANSSGLLLLTNNGELANHLMHPSNNIEREYAVRVFGTVDKTILARLKQGIELEDGPAKFNDIKFSGSSGLNQWYHVSLSEGRNREVRRLWESQGLQVSRLIRIRYGDITLPRSLRRGCYIELNPEQYANIID